MAGKNNRHTYILIAEDNPNMRETIGDILTEDGYMVICVGTLAEAKKVLSTKHYDIVLIDINLPDGLGTDLLYDIKKFGAKTKAIIITGAADLENAIFALNKGAFAYLRKPVDIKILKRYIKNALDHRPLPPP